MSHAESPILIKDIPPQLAHEGLPLKLLNLSEYIISPSSDDGEIYFTMSLADGKPLPSGLVCTKSGEFTGVPHRGTFTETPYSILVIAKNNADVPLITYFDLTISQSKRAQKENHETVTLKSGAAPDLREQLSEYLSLIDYELADELSGEAKTEIAQIQAMAQDMPFSYGQFSEAEFLEFFVRYLVKKYAAVRLYDVLNFNEYDRAPKTSFKTNTGWPVHDEQVSLLTMNPHAYSDSSSTGPLIATLRELIQKAAARGWECIGVMGPHTELAERLVIEYNQQQQFKPSEEQRFLRLNNPMKDNLWLEQTVMEQPKSNERLTEGGV